MFPLIKSPTYTMKIIFFTTFLFLSLANAAQKQDVDLLVYNAKIYTVDEDFSVVQAMAIKDGRIVETGKTSTLRKKYKAKELRNAHKNYIYPGFIDAHAHFLGYAKGLQSADLTRWRSWEGTLIEVKQFAEKNKEGWLLGRGWDQNDWEVKEFPDNKELNTLFPDRPVLLTRIDGHAAIANQKALDIAGIRAGQLIEGGTIETKHGQLTGILIDNAVDLVSSKIPAITEAQAKRLLLRAQDNCFAVGLTTVDDCGIDYAEVLFLDSLQKSGDLKMRIYAMLSDNKKNMDLAFANGPIKTDRMNMRSFKVYADGALGSRGACLLQPYQDKPGWNGFLLSSQQHFDSVANQLYKHKFQMCTHAIGDSGNRVILNIYGKYLQGKNDLRWRIEHAQVVNENDFNLFGKYSVIPSVQPTHATSDSYWAGDRLGSEREKGAYAYKQLLEQNGWIPLGTDFPVEDISPIKTYYAAVFRRDPDFMYRGNRNEYDEPYLIENALTGYEALKGITIWAAKANFEDHEKGSLEKGKLADFVISFDDIMRVSPSEMRQMEILMTFIGGEKVYQRFYDRK